MLKTTHYSFLSLADDTVISYEISSVYHRKSVAVISTCGRLLNIPWYSVRRKESKIRYSGNARQHITEDLCADIIVPRVIVYWNHVVEYCWFLTAHSQGLLCADMTVLLDHHHRMLEACVRLVIYTDFVKDFDDIVTRWIETSNDDYILSSTDDTRIRMAVSDTRSVSEAGSWSTRNEWQPSCCPPS